MKKLYIAVAVMITALVIIFIRGCNKPVEAVNITCPEGLARRTILLDDPESGGMPCVNPEQYERWLSEQKASEESIQEEVRSKPDPVDVGVYEQDSGISETILSESTSAVLGSEINEPKTIQEEVPTVRVDEEVRTVPCEETEETAESIGADSATLHEPNGESPGVLADSGYPVYSVGGIRLGEALEQYLYNQLVARGKGYFYPIALCQLFQESRFNPSAVSPSGLDYGLAQIRITYWDHFAQEAGLVTYDILNPIDNLYVYAYLMCKYLDETSDDIPMSLSLYYSGYGGQYAQHYVDAVMAHRNTLQQLH